jgi:hypothetical protein
MPLATQLFSIPAGAGQRAAAVTNLAIGNDLFLQMQTPASTSAVNFYHALR